MSDIPSAPLLMRFLTKIREVITPNQNILYLGIESIILSILVAGLFYFYIGVTNVIYVLPIAGILLIFLIRVVTVEPDKWKKEQYTMEFSLKLSVISFVVSSIPTGIIYYQYGQVEPVIVLILLLVYTISLYARSKKYLGERSFFTDDYSNVSQEWDMSAVALEKALQQYDKGNKFRTHYWASIAMSHYDEIVEKEERLTLREAASAFSAGCELLMASVFTEGNESYSYYNAAEESFDRGKASLSERVCDDCGIRRRIDRCKRVIDGDKRCVYCDTCQKTGSGGKEQKRSTQDRRKGNRNKSGGRGSRQKSRNTNQKNQTGSRSSSKNRNTDNERSKKAQKNRSERSELMSKKEALNILGVDEDDPSEDDVHEAFRKRVKQSHPDAGGSEEEFKKVKRARERLISE
jgi:hypothetical protein